MRSAMLVRELRVVLRISGAVNCEGTLLDRVVMPVKPPDAAKVGSDGLLPSNRVTKAL